MDRHIDGVKHKKGKRLRTINTKPKVLTCCRKQAGKWDSRWAYGCVRVIGKFLSLWWGWLGSLLYNKNKSESKRGYVRTSDDYASGAKEDTWYRAMRLRSKTEQNKKLVDNLCDNKDNVQPTRGNKSCTWGQPGGRWRYSRGKPFSSSEGLFEPQDPLI